MKLKSGNPFRCALVSAFAVSSILFQSQSASAGDFYWDINGDTAGAGGATPSANWDDANWSFSAAGDVATEALVDGDTPVFAAGSDATGAYTVNLAGTFTLPGLKVEEGFPTISGAGTLNFSSASTTLDIPAGSGLSINTAISAGANSLIKNGNGDLSIGGNTTLGGELRLNGGALSISSTVGNLDKISFQWNYTSAQTLNILPGANVTTNRFVMADLYYSESTVSQSGGTLNVVGNNDTNSTSASFLIGHWGYGSTCVYGLSGGTLNSQSARLSLGWDRSGVQFNQSGGTANLLGINLNNGRGNPASYNLSGGRLNLGSGGINNQSNKSINVGQATIGAIGNWISTKNIRLTGAGNLTVDTLDAIDGTTARNISFTGGVSQDAAAGITKVGAGTLAVSGTVNYTGDTLINGGTFLPGPNFTSSLLVVNPGGSLGAGTLSTPGVSLVNDVDLNGGNLALRVGAAFDQIDATNVNVNQPSTIEVVPSQQLNVNDEFVVLKYLDLTGLGFAGLSPAALPNPHYSASLIDDSANSQVILKITGADSLIWTGAAGNVWDVNNALSWKLASGLPGTVSSKFYDSDVVVFDDSSSVGSVALSGTIKPASITVNNSVTPYAFSGAPIGGGASLTKSGTASLDLSGANLFSGAVSIQGGTVITSTPTSLGTGSTAVTLGTNATLRNTASFTLSRSLLLTGGTAGIQSDAGTTLTLGTPFSGGGNLTKSGDGRLRLQSYTNNSFGGTSITVADGTLEMAGGAFNAYIGIPSITVSAGAELVIPPGAFHALGGAFTTCPTINLNGGTFLVGQEQYLDALNLTGAVIQQNGGNPELRTDYNFQLHTFPSSTTSVYGSGMILNERNRPARFTVDDGPAAIDFHFSGTITRNGSPPSPFTKDGAGKMVVDSDLDLPSGGTIAAGVMQLGNGGASGSLGSGPLTNNATLVINRSDELIIPGVISGTGSLIQSGSGTTVLGGANTYTGDTVVNAGKVAVDGDSIPDSGTLRILGSGGVAVSNIEQVQALYIDGNLKAAGTYGATGSGATHIDDAHFSGTGVVQVVVPGYSGWITGFGLAAGDRDATDDPDQDGLDNGVEWVLGGNPASVMDAGRLPTAAASGANLVFSFIRDQASKSPGTSVAIEVGNNLSGWPGVYQVGDTTGGSSAGVTVTDNGNGTDTVTLTIPRAPDASKYGRLRVVIQ